MSDIFQDKAKALVVEHVNKRKEKTDDPARARTGDIDNGRTLQLYKSSEELSVARRRRIDIFERDVKLF